MARDLQHRLGRVAIELAVHPSDEILRRRLGQRAVGGLLVDHRLHAHVRGGLELQIAPRLVGVELAGQRPLDVARPRVMALDQVAVVGVHDPHEIGEVRRRPRMQRLAERRRRRRQLRDDIRDRPRRVGQPGRLDAVDGLQGGHIWPISIDLTGP